MAIYYTEHEGGYLIKLPFRTMNQKVSRQLYKNRYQYFSFIYKIRVHSVFFCKGRRVTKIWDAHTNGYRIYKNKKKLILPNILK